MPPGFMEIVAGTLGVAWGLNGLSALRRRAARHSNESFINWALIATGGLLALAGVAFYAGVA